MTHVEALDELFKQFDSYKSNCIRCDINICGDCNLQAIEVCDDFELICRNKLLEAARELDG